MYTSQNQIRRHKTEQQKRRRKRSEHATAANAEKNKMIQNTHVHNPAIRVQEWIANRLSTGKRRNRAINIHTFAKSSN